MIILNRLSSADLLLLMLSRSTTDGKIIATFSRRNIGVIILLFGAPKLVMLLLHDYPLLRASTTRKTNEEEFTQYSCSIRHFVHKLQVVVVYYFLDSRPVYILFVYIYILLYLLYIIV